MVGGRDWGGVEGSVFLCDARDAYQFDEVQRRSRCEDDVLESKMLHGTLLQMEGTIAEKKEEEKVLPAHQASLQQCPPPARPLQPAEQPPGGPDLLGDFLAATILLPLEKNIATRGGQVLT